jgi:hypothetical protein
MSGRRLGGRERGGMVLSVLGLAALGVSLAGGGSGTGRGSTGLIALWLGGTADGIAGGLFFSIGDISTKVATEGGARSAFVLLILGYTLGTALLQLGYQRGGAVTVAGLATLLTNALPIAAGPALFGEPVPAGAFGALRILAFAAVTAGAILLARPARSTD